MPFTGNSNYVGNAAFAIEQSVRKDWQLVWTQAHPLLSVLAKNQTNFNRGFTPSGLKMLLAVMGSDLTTPVAGVTSGSTELTADTYNTTTGFSQFAYNFAHYRGNYTILESEATLAANGARGNLLEGKKSQFLGSFQNKLSNDFSTTTADASDNSKVLGLYQPLSTSNTVGGISQSTDTNIASNVKAGAGPFALELIDDQVDTITSKSNQTRMIVPDLVLASFAATNNVYGKVRSAIAPAERMENPGDTAQYGFKNFVYMGLRFGMDNRIGTTLSGSLAILTTSTWFVYVQKEPKMHPLTKVPGTDAYEQVGTMWAALGCNDPAANALIRDIS